MAPIVNGLEKKYSGQFKIERVNIDTAAGKKLARQYGIIGQPAIILFDQSGQEVRRLIGEHTAERFQQEIERILAE